MKLRELYLVVPNNNSRYNFFWCGTTSCSSTWKSTNFVKYFFIVQKVVSHVVYCLAKR
jgi:hypothetical protein